MAACFTNPPTMSGGVYLEMVLCRRRLPALHSLILLVFTPILMDGLLTSLSVFFRLPFGAMNDID